MGEGTIGAGLCLRLLCDGRFAQDTFSAELPVDEPGNERRNVAARGALSAA